MIIWLYAGNPILKKKGDQPGNHIYYSIYGNLRTTHKNMFKNIL